MVYKVYIIEWAQPIFDYTMSQVRIRACTKIRIWRMYIIEPVGEMVYKVYIIEWAQPIFDYTMSQVRIRACRKGVKDGTDIYERKTD